jgi:ABC-type glycerol-3-phosphate transport system substrate-binding protein
MTMVRALFLACLLAGLALVACGSAGSGGAAPTSTIPAVGTNTPTNTPMASGDPYSEYGY